MKRNVYFTSDQHFYHDNIIKYCDRPFVAVEEMNEKIISRYNYLVRDCDMVYFLGDIGFDRNKQIKAIISRLKGIKVLIIGNHDKQGRITYLNMGFSVVLDYAEIKIGKNNVTLAHYPKRTIREYLRLAWLYWTNPRKIGQPMIQRFNRLRKEWKRHRRPTNKWHICGHVHNAWKVNKKNINVSVDVWGFAPVSVGKILKIINQEGVK